jgi:hypothetical protein
MSTSGVKYQTLNYIWNVLSNFKISNKWTYEKQTEIENSDDGGVDYNNHPYFNGFVFDFYTLNYLVSDNKLDGQTL